jgi:hypothetical protein
MQTLLLLLCNLLPIGIEKVPVTAIKDVVISGNDGLAVAIKKYQLGF